VTSDERHQLAKAWIALQTTPKNSPEYNPLFWSFEQAHRLVREDPVEAWSLILTVWSLDKSPISKQSLSGLVEELLCYHGEFMIERVERKAKADRSFATLLGGVWQNTMPNDVWNRLQDVWIAPDGALFLHHAAAPQRERLPATEVVESTLLEFAKLASLLLCMLSLYAIFRTLFLSVEDPQPIYMAPQVFNHRVLNAFFLISISAGISFLGGIIFRAAEPEPHPSLASTLPLQIFYWATSIMIALFVIAWFLETHYIFTPIKHW
jgi:hypothetical protein